MLTKKTLKRVIPGADRAHDDAKFQEGDAPSILNLPEGVVISPDTLRGDRVPPGQTRTRKWPVLDAFGPPEMNMDTWRLSLFGLVEAPVDLTWEEYEALPRTKVFADMHCVTRWSRLGNIWSGVSTRDLLKLVKPKSRVTHVIAYGYDNGWTTNIPLDEFLNEDVLIADHHDDMAISIEHGGPARLIVPRLYAWKSAKWLRGFEFTDADRPGFWERGGYHMLGNPWQEERFRSRWW